MIVFFGSKGEGILVDKLSESGDRLYSTHSEMGAWSRLKLHGALFSFSELHTVSRHQCLLG